MFLAWCHHKFKCYPCSWIATPFFFVKTARNDEVLVIMAYLLSYWACAKYPKTFHIVILSFRKKAKYPQNQSVLNPYGFFCYGYALQPVGSLRSKWHFFCHTEALAEVSINLRRVLNFVDFSLSDESSKWQIRRHCTLFANLKSAFVCHYQQSTKTLYNHHCEQKESCKSLAWQS